MTTHQFKREAELHTSLISNDLEIAVLAFDSNWQFKPQYDQVVNWLETAPISYHAATEGYWEGECDKGILIAYPKHYKDVFRPKLKEFGDIYNQKCILVATRTKAKKRRYAVDLVFTDHRKKDERLPAVILATGIDAAANSAYTEVKLMNGSSFFFAYI